MKTAKLVDDLLVNLEYQADKSPRSCFVVFSSREAHVEIVIDCIENVFQESEQFQVVRLDQRLKSGDSQYEELTEILSSCCFAVVVLDGFRPNVLFEYGILKGLHKPCIVLVADKATVDVQGFFSNDIQDIHPAPQIDMDKHFSDVKDRFYINYNKNNPKQIRSILQDAYEKLKPQIEDEFLHSIFPNKEIIEDELKANLNMIISVFTMSVDDFDGNEIAAINLAHSHVRRIAKAHNVLLPPRYFAVLARTYAKIDAVDKALSIIDGGLSGEHDDAFLLSDKAYILRKSGRLEESLEALKDAIRINPKAEFLWHNKALTLDKLGRIDDAVRCYKKAIKLDSGCANVHYHYGIILYQKKDFKSALNKFNKALQIRPEDTVFLLWKARTLNYCDKKQDARKIIEKLIADDSTNVDAWFVLGCIEDNETEALGYFRKVIQLNPKHSGALCSSAARLSNLGKLDEALDIFSEMYKHCSRYETCPTLNSNINITLKKINPREDRITACEKIVAIYPRHIGALRTKAYCLARLGNHDGALEILTEVLLIIPKDAEVLYDQACIYALAKRYDEAMQSLQNVIAIDKKYEEDAKHDSDFSGLRRTNIYRDTFGKITDEAPPKKKNRKKVSRK